MALANGRYLCMEDEEYVDHLLFHCIKKRILWELLLFIWNHMGDL